MREKLLHYEIVERLGRGAGSTIYSVIDPRSGQRYAMKHVVREHPKDIRFVAQMEVEFHISSQFDHPVLRKSYELKVRRGFWMRVKEVFLLMELAEGRSLDIYCPRDTVEILNMFIQVGQGLKAMHAMGLLHCDLKPNNIICDDHGRVKIIDYGQSCKVGTIKERIQGTPDYIAPEQVSRRPVTVHTDVFNLGATLYWVLTKKAIPTLYTVNRKGNNSFLMDTRIETPAELNPRVPAALSNLVMESVASNPRKRPADMDEVITRLELAKHVASKATAGEPQSQPDMEARDDSASKDDSDATPQI